MDDAGKKAFLHDGAGAEEKKQRFRASAPAPAASPVP